jgi:hypothetical protein
MFKVWVDEEKNRIFIKLGHIGTGEGRQIFDEVKSKLHLLKPGFAGISDITDFHVNDPKEGVWAGKVLELFAEAKIGIAARVTGSKKKSKQVKGRHGYPVIVVETLEKAVKILDRL